jgi:hypothetical protein
MRGEEFGETHGEETTLLASERFDPALDAVVDTVEALSTDRLAARAAFFRESSAMLPSASEAEQRGTFITLSVAFSTDAVGTSTTSFLRGEL